MKDGLTIEEYLEYVKHLLNQAEENGYIYVSASVG